MLQVLGLLFWLLVVPFCIGLLPGCRMDGDKKTPGFLLLAGYFVMWAAFEVVALPCVIFLRQGGFAVLSMVFMILAIALAAVGAVSALRRRGRYGLCIGLPIGGMPWPERIEWLLFLALLAFQLYRAAAYTSFDGDDAYYVVESLLAQRTGMMYRFLPYTGGSTALDTRHALAVFPMWIAFVGAKSHIHTTILSHFVLPFVLIPLSYLVYYEIGRLLFRLPSGKTAGEDVRADQRAGRAAKGKDAAGEEIFRRENLPIFMILMAMFQIFGNVSIYTNETFFLTRTWQGKAVAGSLVIPAVLWMVLWIYGETSPKHNTADRKHNAADQERSAAGEESDGADKKHRTADRRRGGNAGMWLLFVCINMTAAVCSSMAAFLICMLMGLAALCVAFVRRNPWVILQMGLVCIPNAIYMLMYVLLR